MMNKGIIRTVFTAGLLLLTGCAGGISLRGLTTDSWEDEECVTRRFDGKVQPFILDTLRQRQASSCERFGVHSQYGSIKKFVKLYRTDYSGRPEKYLLLFHFFDRYEDVANDGILRFVIDGDTLSTPVVIDPASVIITNAADQFFYVFLDDSEINALAGAKKAGGFIGTIDFHFSYSCRELWREFLQRYNN